ncbi:MAG: hypothetical protein ACREPD_03715 [Stenotrophomonas sp.]|uniref:hypothetical protein n=1 Tax=Stenotrophomonas sp. TaxID=69392 RepID=UPI003D6CF5E2
MVFLLFIGVPLLVYVGTLATITGRPEPVAADGSAGITCRNQRVANMHSLASWSVSQLFGTARRLPPGHEEASWLAKDHLSSLPRTGMLVWHLRSAVLHVWIVRHWSPQQITDTARLGGACRNPRISR